MNTEQKVEFKNLADQMIKFLNDHGHPHMQVIITTTDAEIVEGVYCHNKKR